MFDKSFCPIVSVTRSVYSFTCRSNSGRLSVATTTFPSDTSRNLGDVHPHSHQMLWVRGRDAASPSWGDCSPKKKSDSRPGTMQSPLMWILRLCRISRVLAPPRHIYSDAHAHVQRGAHCRTLLAGIEDVFKGFTPHYPS